MPPAPRFSPAVLLLSAALAISFTAAPARADDCDDDGVEDLDAIAMGLVPDCNGNGVPDYCDIWVYGTSLDCDNDGVPDDCETDCNANGVPDICDIRDGASRDDDGNGVPDECDLAAGAPDCNGNDIPDAADLLPGLAFAISELPFTASGGLHTPIDTQSGDLNGDLRPDIVTANRTSFTVGVLLNTGGGSFATGAVYPAGGGPESVALADFDGDGDLDVAAAVLPSFPPYFIRIFTNDGHGVLTPAASYSAGNVPIDVIAADLDGDDDLDLAVANINGGDISILRNDGSGAFSAPFSIPVGPRPLSITAADLDGDDDLDLAVCVQNLSTVSILENLGGGTFAAPVAYPMGDFYSPLQTEAADLDGDDDLDLAVALYYSRNVGVMLNNGDGTFGPVTAYPAAGGNAAGITVADFDGDGELDAAVASSPPLPTGVVSVLRGKGDGTLRAPTSWVGGDSPLSIDSADYDGDGRPDLAAGAYQNLAVRLFLNRTSPALETDINGDGIPDSCQCIVDLNGDGLVDFADYLEFLNRYDAQDPSVDFNQDGLIDFADYLEFLNLYEAGC
ncbi:MAG: VCBS repeat-containing protein [Phycisphaerales bacterium]|nr:VCBS repeat-containing protein [Phycisphaerales bacterium]